MNITKFLLGLLLSLCLTLSVASCGLGAGESLPADAGTPASTAAPDGEARTLVAYFSATGHTRAVAEQIAELTGGDLYEILPAEAYTEADLDYGDDQSRTSLEMDDPDARPEISSAPIAMEDYSVLYLGYPIWHGQAPRIMNTFVEQYAFDGITVIPFCTSGGSGIGSSAENLAALAGSGDWREGQRFRSGTAVEALRAWIESVQ